MDKGPSLVRIGFDWRSYQYSLENPGTSPLPTHSRTTKLPFAPPAQNTNTSLTGDPFASLLLGLPDMETLTTSSHFSRWAQNYYAMYAQDDFKARSNLTLNLGLRWDIETPRHEAIGAQSVLSLTTPNSLSPGQPGAMVYGKGATGASTYFKNFGPRIGFAYSPGFVKNTVIRGAYSIYYAPLTYSDFGGSLASGTTASPNFQTAITLRQYSPWMRAFHPTLLPATRKTRLCRYFTQNGSTMLRRTRAAGMVQNWDMEIQHQLATDLIFSVGYIGQHATRLRSNLAQVNTPNPMYNSLGHSWASGRRFRRKGRSGNSSRLGVTVPSWFVPGWGERKRRPATIGQLLRPFPQYWKYHDQLLPGEPGPVHLQRTADKAGAPFPQRV